MAAITWTTALSAPSVMLDRGSGHVAVEWAGMAVVDVYVSHNSGMAAFENFLDGVGECVRRCLPLQVLVLGDFSAHSSQWGNARTDARGRNLSDWATGLGLLLVNRGSASTWRDVERILCDRRYMGYLRGLQENFQLESGRRGRLHTDGGGPPQDNVPLYRPAVPEEPTTKVASQGEGQGDAPDGSLRLRLELGRTKNVGKRRRGSRKSSKGHERGV